MDTLIRVEQTLPLTIFDKPCIHSKVTQLFDGSEEKFKARYNEIITFLNAKPLAELSYENVSQLFKVNFYKLILNEAVELTFSGRGGYNALSNILSLLSEERLANAIFGKPMVDAFSTAIRSIPKDSALSTCLYGGKILLLEKEFLGVNYLLYK